MDDNTMPPDPLDLAIAATEEAIRVAASDIEDAESHIVAKNLEREKLGLEVKILKRAAELRPGRTDQAGSGAADPLDREITGLEAILSQSELAVAAIEDMLATKRRGLDSLQLEVRALRRAASLRPAAAAAAAPKEVSEAPAVEQPAMAANLPPRGRGLFGQIRTSDPRLPVLPGG